MPEENDFSEKPKQFWNKSKDAAKKVSDSVQNSLHDESNSKLYAALAYVPIIGPIMVFVFKKNQKLAMFHAQNAGYLQISFFLIYLAVWLFEFLPILSQLLGMIQFVPYMTDAIKYINIMGLLVLSVMGAIQANAGKLWTVPYLYDFFNKMVNKSSDNKQLPNSKD